MRYWFDKLEPHLGAIMAFILILIFMGTAHCQEAKFWDIQRVASNSMAYTIAGIDAAQTCYHLGNTPGWHEKWGPTQSCSGMVAYIAGGQMASTFGQYYLWKNHHDRLSRMIPMISIMGNGVAVGYSFTH